MSIEMLYHEVMGVDRDPIVFIPGLGGTTRYWKSRIEHLSSERKIILVDPLGFGKSPKPKAIYNLERHIAELHRLFKGQQKFTIVGHSMGTILAIAYAARYPEQVNRLVLLSIPYYGSEQDAIHYFRQRNYWLLTNYAFAAITCIMTRRLFGRLLPYILKDLPKEVVEDMVSHSWRSFTSTLWEVIYRVDLQREADQLPKDLAVLCLHGDQDTTAPLDGACKLVEGRANWQLRILPGGDHHPLLNDATWCLDGICMEAF